MIRHSTLADLPRIMELFEAAKGIMRSDGNYKQWTGGYPQEEVARRDIEKGNSYVVEDPDGKVTGTFVLITRPAAEGASVEPTYDRIYEGEWLDAEAPYAVLHRLASEPDSHGIAAESFAWSWERCKELNVDFRIDTHEDNHIMQHVVLDFGFVYCGVIYLANGDPRLAYQKLRAAKAE